MAFENLYLIVLLTDTKKRLNSLRIETFGKANMIKYGRTIRYTLYPGFLAFLRLNRNKSFSTIYLKRKEGYQVS